MQMMGLIQPPEPKFKLSNFMKVLGDQAVADPSKVEQRVMQQVYFFSKLSLIFLR